MNTPANYYSVASPLLTPLIADPDASRYRVTSPDRGDFVIASTGNIIVNYTGFIPQAQAAFQYAADIWGSLIDSPVPIEIDATFTNLGSGILGQAGPTLIYRDFPSAPQSSTWYAVALANALGNTDFNGNEAEIAADFNSNFDWYYGTDGNTPSNQYDFASVVLHEIGHGLGFLGLWEYFNSSGQGRWGIGSGFPSAFDRFVENGAGQSLINPSIFPNPSVALGNQLTSNNIFFDGANANAGNRGSRVPLYAPSIWNSGSSISHLGEVYNNTPNALMTYSLGPGEAIHNPGPVALGILADTGWTINDGEPTLPTVSVRVSPSRVTENGTANLVYTFTRNGSTGSALNNVNFTVAGTASLSNDYSQRGASSFSSTSGRVNFAAGSSTAIITIDPRGDSTVEPNETVALTLRTGTGYSLGSPSSATGTITNGDGITTITRSNSNRINLPGSGTMGHGNPYPSTINVSGVSRTITKVTATLKGLSHTWSDDLDVLLVGPRGQKVMLMSDAGGSSDLTGVNLGFSSSATATLPDQSQIVSGTYLPTNYGTGDTFSSPAPTGSYSSSLSVFNSTNPNGDWKLFVMDDDSLDSGAIAQGWQLTIQT